MTEISLTNSERKKKAYQGLTLLSKSRAMFSADSVRSYLGSYTLAYTLGFFRICFGVLISGSMIRFWSNGWIEQLYVKPHHFFPFYGFEWVQPLGPYTYLIFALVIVSAIFVTIGLYYRPAIITLFVSFTYIELIDKSTYLNHYYFVSLLCFLMIFLPAHVCFAADAAIKPKSSAVYVPRWCIDSIKLLVFILYFYAGLAKLNSDWLLHALPLRIWLPARNDMPVIGALFNYEQTAYIFSWFGCIYDLTIVFFLINPKTRVAAYATVVIFHLLTAALFPIGMFPYIMIVTGLIFFDGHFHRRVLLAIAGFVSVDTKVAEQKAFVYKPLVQSILISGFAFFFLFQLIFPFRFLLYPGKLFWTEEGYRFSWRVMLMEKAGFAEFTVSDGDGREVKVNNADFLTPLQEKMMATQPDMLLQYAHLLRDYYRKQGFQSPQVHVDSYVSLNGHLGRPLIDPNTDLANQIESFGHKAWILPFNNETENL